ncbi:MAG TPA: FG-GAP-like repeat-containing protein [Xanthomonadaceae bacterium]|nr:FG-GAP-like repeat-containing protein [Xanthomonadaceae bacterium]
MGAVAAIVAGCSADVGPVSERTGSVAPATASPIIAASAGGQATATTRIADLPDRGELLAYGDKTVRRGDAVWRPVHISEARAFRAIGAGQGLALRTPDGAPVRLVYARHVEHPDGSWTWVGRPVGGTPGSEAILTFGAKAVFGSIPNPSGNPLEITMASGRTWMVETDASHPSASAAAASRAAKPAEPDFLVAPAALRQAAARASAAAPRRATAEASASLSAYTVDIGLGYTTGFAARLGGRSQALTRLNFLVDVTNQAYLNSRINAQLRLVHATEVDYPDATTNRSALFDLSGLRCVSSASGSQLPDGGVNCDPDPVPASLQPLLDARERYGADLVALVRKFEYPENQSCGIAWMLGGGQSDITPADAALGLAVISDSSGTLYADSGNSCRNDALAHELGHNMGLQHDREVAAGSDDSNTDGDPLDPQEYGRYPYAFGYTEGTEGGNFYDIMAIRRSGRVSYLVFSSPRITACGGNPCGVAEVADASRALAQTIPVIANFRASTTRVAHDFNGDGRSDLFWRNGTTGANIIWETADSTTPRGVAATAPAWTAAAMADFTGDGRTDVLWRNTSTGENVLWKAANSGNAQAITGVTNLAWKLSGAGDFDGDGRADILWHNGNTGANIIWRSGDSSTTMPVKAIVDVAWNLGGIGDFDGDGTDDILWRNGTTGANVVWRSANAATPLAVRSVTDTNWKVAGVDDFDGDGEDDILWHNDATGGNAIWKSANANTPQVIAQIRNTAWKLGSVGDFDGDGLADILWRNSGTGQNLVWAAANGSAWREITAVTNLSWGIAN